MWGGWEWGWSGGQERVFEGFGPGWRQQSGRSDLHSRKGHKGHGWVLVGARGPSRVLPTHGFCLSGSMEAQGWNTLGDGIAGELLGADTLGSEECCGVVRCEDILQGADGNRSSGWSPEDPLRRDRVGP